ncbi:MAG: YCF48-related protein [Bacteroidota bacterium]
MKKYRLTFFLLSCFYQYLVANHLSTATGLSTTLDATTTPEWVALASGTDEILHDIHFVDSSTGWAVGANGTIIKTTDGGLSWTPLTSGVSSSLRGVHFIDSNTGYVVGFPEQTGEEVVLITTDGGVTWDRQSPSGFTSYYDVDIIGSNNGAVVGTSNGNGVTLWPTGGSTFNYFIPVFGTELNGVDFLDTNAGPSSAVGWAVGDGGTIIKSSSGGVLWNIQTSPTTEDLLDVSCTDVNTCWAVGWNSIIGTIDGGTTWSSLSFPPTPPLSLFYSVAFTDSNTGWVVGFQGSILHTTDGGANWEIQTSGTSENLFGVFFTDANTGWAVGEEGTILKYGAAGLPVTLLSFEGQVLDKAVQLNWQTASETNNQGFWVERSATGSSWNALAFINGTGTAIEQQHYSYLDEQALAGMSYYRLQQVDFDGTYKYSPTISIYKSEKRQSLAVYPNPVEGRLLHVIIPTDAMETPLQLNVYNNFGQLVETHLFEPMGKFQLELSQLQAGAYTLVLFCDGKRWSERVVIE